MARCLISFGANMGDPLETIRTASDWLRLRLVGEPSASGKSLGSFPQYQLSRYFRTPPVGGPSGQPPFVNAVAALHTELTAIEVWQTIREVEQQLGRQRDRRWEARRIDLDILLYDDLRIWTPQLKIPHPRMCMRRFILIPAMDVAPTWHDPVSGWSVARLAATVRSGPGNLLILSDDPVRHAAWLPEIARHTMADIIAWDTAQRSSSSRWISLAALGDWPQALRPGQPPTGASLAKLIVILTSQATQLASDQGLSDWEGQHLELASRLRLLPSHSVGRNPSASEIPLEGPRYLLSGDDQAWASHEIASALEAMDCPVEPLADP